ncbi:MAG: DUF3662 domain-containing protein, partial [Anaerolineae bacterium]|nr:DUF3662 domain-containing protein [Anaerolineae bacterium]
EVALRLARAMEDGADLDDAGFLSAPTRYRVSLNPADHAALLTAQPDLGAIMARHITALAGDSDLRLDSAPEVILESNGAIPPHHVTVQAEHVSLKHDPTQALAAVDLDQAGDAPAGRAGTGALPAVFLVIDGDRYVPLDRPVINIGRQRDNAVVLDNPRVSRQHCQLRLRFGRFVLYDLGSRGGTTVNGARVTECVLNNGDVIELAGIPLVYVVEEDSSQQAAASAGDTQAMPPTRKSAPVEPFPPPILTPPPGDDPA